MYRILLFFTVFVLIPLMFFSCSSVKHLDEGEKLLVKNKINIISDEKKDGISEDDMGDIIRPRPNSKILFFRLNLQIYNLYSPEKTKKKEEKRKAKCEKKLLEKTQEYDSTVVVEQKRRDAHPKGSEEYIEHDKKLKEAQSKSKKARDKDCEHTLWTHRIGEAPVLYKINDQYRNARQLRIYLKNKGYYYPVVRPNDKLKGNKKVMVEYTVKPGVPYRLKDSVEYSIRDSNIMQMVLRNEHKTFLPKGERLDVDLLQKERDRITGFLRDSGYYKFTKNYITYTIDTTGMQMEAKVTMNIANLQAGNATQPHKKYYINRVNVHPDFDPRLALTEKENYFARFTEKRYLYNNKEFHFYENGKPKLKPKSIMQGIYVNQDSLYQVQDIQATYKYLTGMEIIKIANIDFKEVTDSTKFPRNFPPNSGLLDCDIKISNNLSQARTFEIQGTNTNGNLGAAGSATYTHRNVFRNAEVFNFSVKGSLERQTNYASQDVVESDLFFNSRELAVEAGLKFPRFVAPLKLKSFIKRSNPGTELLLNYSYLQRPEYIRTVAGFSYGYFWNQTPSIEWMVKLVSLDFVNLENPTEGFLEYIRRYNLQGSYEDHFVFGSGYSFVYNNSHEKEKNNTWYFRANLKLAGNTLFGIMNLIEGNNDPGKSISNNVFAQFSKLDFDLRRYTSVAGSNHTLVMRLFAGSVLPYGNLDVVPFGEKYFSGGANGVRAWQVRALGPGAYTYQDETDLFPNRTADIKLEANLEYRFKLFWMLEGAYFIDAGNIWAINSTDDREGALFEPNDFYKEIAIGTGLGFRLDFDFFIVRFDFGLKLKDPSLPEGERWIPMNRGFEYEDWTFNVGIGYPF